jgi:hypothetical protein
MAKRTGGRYLGRWNKKKIVPRLTKCIAIHGDYAEKEKKCVVKVLQVNPSKNALQIFSALCIFALRISFIGCLVKQATLLPIL